MTIEEIEEIIKYLGLSWGDIRIDIRKKMKVLCKELLEYKRDENFNETSLMLENKFGNTHLKGFKYLVYILENYRYPVPSIMQMYEEVADKFNTTQMNVERCLRTYIEVVYNKKITVSKFVSKQLIEFGRVGKCSRILIEDIEDKVEYEA